MDLSFNNFLTKSKKAVSRGLQLSTATKTEVQLQVISKNTKVYKSEALFYSSQLFPALCTMNTLLLISSLVLVAVSADDVVRKPKLFFVSTSATTSTLKTGSVCYVSSATAVVSCGGRKRRSIDIKEAGSAVDPSQASDGKEVSGGKSHHREGRFFLYWITTTSISVSTSYTSTITISSVQCTPSGATLCG